MFVHCIKPSSSIMYNLWKWSDGRGRKSCIDCQAQHGHHVPTLIGQCGIDKFVTYLREISIEHDVRRYKRIFFNIWPIVVWCKPQMSTLFCFGKSRIGIRSKRHHQILNDHSPKGPLIAYTSDLNRYVTEVTSINEHHSFFKMPISKEQFQSLLHCECEANPNPNNLHRRNVESAQLPREVTGTWDNHPDSALDPNPIGRAYRRDLSIVITKPLKSHQVQVKNWNSWTLCQIAGITLYSIISRWEVFNQKSNGAFVGNIDKVSINHFNSPCGGRSLPTPQSPFGRQVGTTRNAHEYRFSRQRNGMTNIGNLYIIS